MSTWVNGNISEVNAANLADGTGYAFVTAQGYQKFTATIQYHTTPLDGLGGLFYWDQGSVAGASNDVIVPVFGPVAALGRWVRAQATAPAVVGPPTWTDSGTVDTTTPNDLVVVDLDDLPGGSLVGPGAVTFRINTLFLPFANGTDTYAATTYQHIATIYKDNVALPAEAPVTDVTTSTPTHEVVQYTNDTNARCGVDVNYNSSTNVMTVRQTAYDFPGSVTTGWHYAVTVIAIHRLDNSVHTVWAP